MTWPARLRETVERFHAGDESISAEIARVVVEGGVLHVYYALMVGTQWTSLLDVYGPQDGVVVLRQTRLGRPAAPACVYDERVL